MNAQYTKDAAKVLKSLDAATRARIIRGVAELEKEPPEGDIKRLTGRDGAYRMRIGDWRILFHYGIGCIVIDRIASRGQAYK